MDLQWSKADLEFRDEVRTFFAETLTPEFRRAGALMTSVYADHELGMAWQRIMAKKGWAAPAWPVEYGGCDWSVTQHYIFARERVAAGAPPVTPMGIQMVGPVIIHYGTAEQKAYYLPKILTGEHFWCQGYSEPNSGSDLASLQMEAIDDGDHLVCTGSKIWTTHANVANWIFCLVRTTKSEKKQQGITFLLIDMTSPGVEVRPLVMTSGEHIQNQVFFDHVRVPKANVMGEIDKGWTVAKYLLDFERGGAYAPGLQARLDELARAAASVPADGGGALIDDPLFAAKLAAARARLDVLEVYEFRVMARLSKGESVGASPSVMKIMGTEMAQALTELAVEAAGAQAFPYQPHAGVPGGPLPHFTPPNDAYISGEPWMALAPLRYMNERAGSIYGGSNEIQRGIVAKAVLGL